MNNRLSSAPTKASSVIGTTLLIGIVLIVLGGMGSMIALPTLVFGARGALLPLIGGLVFLIAALLTATIGDFLPGAALTGGMGLILITSGTAMGLAFLRHWPHPVVIGLGTSGAILGMEVVAAMLLSIYGDRNQNIRSEFLALPLPPDVKAELLNKLDGQESTKGKEEILRIARSRAIA